MPDNPRRARKIPVDAPAAPGVDFGDFFDLDIALEELRNARQNLQEVQADVSRLEFYREILTECQEALHAIQKELGESGISAVENLELQKYYDARRMHEQIVAFSALSTDEETPWATRCERFVPIFRTMAEIVRDANRKMPQEYKREGNGYGKTLLQLYLIVAGSRGRTEREAKEGTAPSETFSQAARDFQKAVEQAYEELAEEPEAEPTPEERQEIADLEARFDEASQDIESAVDISRRLWQNPHLSTDARIDCLTRVIELITEHLDFENEDE